MHCFEGHHVTTLGEITSKDGNRTEIQELDSISHVVHDGKSKASEVRSQLKNLESTSSRLSAQYNKVLHTVSFNWFLSGLEWILNLEFCLLKLLIFYQKLLWNIRSRLNSSTLWVFRNSGMFEFSLIKIDAFCTKMEILIKNVWIQAQ